MQNIFDKRACLSREEMKAFLDQSLDKSSLIVVENHLLDCQLCSEALEGIKLNPDILNKLPREFMQTSDIKKEVELKTIEYPLNNNRYWLRIAAGVILLIGITSLLWQYMNKPAGNNLYTDNFKPLPPISNTVRGENSNAKSETISDAMMAYGLGQYNKAINLFKQNLVHNSLDNESQLYLGISYLADNRPQNAIDALRKVRINSEEYFNEASWYLALSYLKMSDAGKTEKILHELVKNESVYSEQARVLLIKINQ
ncbi:MAG TPA: tetratricopeptide repeat protein [Saprospiraceae bacterium]|nr:tetratricopeptide repeat protein [Saprospiraceae bacterium]